MSSGSDLRAPDQSPPGETCVARGVWVRKTRSPIFLLLLLLAVVCSSCGGLVSAPPPAARVSVVLPSDPTRSGSSSVTIQQIGSLSVSPDVSSLTTSQTLQLQVSTPGF